MPMTAPDPLGAAVRMAGAAMEEYYRAGGERHHEAMRRAIQAYLRARAENDMGWPRRWLQQMAAELDHAPAETAEQERE